MHRLLTTLAALLLTFGLARTEPFKPGEFLPDGVYVVFRVLDGDTLTIKHEGVERSVRFIGLNTPELEPPQPFAREAAAFTALYAAPGTAVMLVGEGPRVDRFGRGLAHVYLLDPSGRPSAPLAALLVSQGLAKTGFRDDAQSMRRLYEAAEAGARSVAKGLWVGERFVDKDCRDFRTQTEAQAFAVAAALPNRRDPHGLDSDGDSVACGRLPRTVPSPIGSS